MSVAAIRFPNSQRVLRADDDDEGEKTGGKFAFPIYKLKGFFLKEKSKQKSLKVDTLRIKSLYLKLKRVLTNRKG